MHINGHGAGISQSEFTFKGLSDKITGIFLSHMSISRYVSGDHRDCRGIVRQIELHRE